MRIAPGPGQGCCSAATCRVGPDTLWWLGVSLVTCRLMSTNDQDFAYSLAAEPHKARTQQILGEHPEIRELIGTNASTFWWTAGIDRKSTRLNSSHSQISYAVFCLKKKKRNQIMVDLVLYKLMSVSAILYHYRLN